MPVAKYIIHWLTQIHAVLLQPSAKRNEVFRMTTTNIYVNASHG